MTDPTAEAWATARANAPEGFRLAFGIPYARANGDGSVTCPRCGERIVETERKDFESTTGSEYAVHYDANHAVADGRIEVDGFMYEPIED